MSITNFIEFERIAMLERYLIDCCAPTLASLKSGSLFCTKCPADACIEGAIEKWNSDLSDLGVHMCILRRTESSALIYVYRKTSLARTLKDPDVREFLSSYGYEACTCCEGCKSADCSISDCLAHLTSRISAACDSEAGDGDMRFPHEIGVFLGYPLQDVKGFIDNNGRNSKYTGLWKVYGDTEASIRTFAKYKHCSRVYSDLWKSGKRSILQLTVAG